MTISIWMNNLDHTVDDTKLASWFLDFSSLVSAKVIQIPHRPTGCGVVQFSSREEAVQVMEQLNGKPIPNNPQKTFDLSWEQRVSVPPVPGSAPKAAASLAIFVGDLDPTVTELQLVEKFKERYSSVESANIVKDSATGRPKGYGFVRFLNSAEGHRAMVEMNGVFLGTRPMRVSSSKGSKNSTFLNPLGILFGQQFAQPQPQHQFYLQQGASSPSIEASKDFTKKMDAAEENAEFAQSLLKHQLLPLEL